MELNEINRESCKCIPLDWAEPHTDRTFTPYRTVIASEVIYQEAQVPVLSEMILTALSSGGVAYIVNAAKGRDGLDAFREALDNQSRFTVNETSVPCPATVQEGLCPFEPDQRFVMFRITVSSC